MKKNINTAVLLALFQIILLVAIFMLYILQYRAQHAQTPKHLLILCFFAGSIALNFVIVSRMVKVCEKEAHLSAREDMARSFASIAESIKTQNQNFKFYTEEIQRLLQEGRWGDLSGYLENIGNKITVSNDVLKVDNAIIGALLKAKAAEADTKHIRLDIDICASLAGQLRQQSPARWPGGAGA